MTEFRPSAGGADESLTEFVTEHAKRDPETVLNVCEKLCIETVEELMYLRLRTGGLVGLGENFFTAGEAILLEKALDVKAADRKSVIESAASGPDEELKKFVTDYAKRNPEAVLDACEKLCIETVADLMSLRLRTGLVELLEGIPAGEAMLLETALDDWAAETKSVIESADSMDGILTNLGIVAALIGATSAGVFTGIAADEWQTYKELQAPTWPPCQPFATWPPAENRSAYLYVEGSAYTSMEECTEDMTEIQERWFVQLNTCGGLCMMIVVLMTSWLYIAIHSSHAVLSRPEELKLVVGVMRPFFALLQLVFLVGVVTGGLGVCLFIQVKCRNQVLARWVTNAIVTASVGLFAGFILSIVSWFLVKRKVKFQRKNTANKAKKMVAKMAGGPASQRSQDHAGGWEA